MLNRILAVSGLCLMLACQPTPPSGHSHGDDTHTHGTEEEEHAHAEEAALSFTRWTDRTELFVEFPPLVVGQTSRFAAHFTQLADYQPVREGQLTVSLIVGEKGVRQTIDAPQVPGIFNPALQPTTAGTGRLIFELSTPEYTERIVLSSLPVYASPAEAKAQMVSSQPPDEGINFLKEQAWKIDFAVAPVTRQPVSEVIRTSGEIKPAKGQEKVVVAKNSGLVFYNIPTLQQGRTTRQGEPLFTISSEGLVQANMEEKYRIARARLDKARSDLQRAETLLEQQVISRKEYERRQMEADIAEAAYQTLTNSFQAEGRAVTANLSGIIKNILVTNGAYVSEGTPLATITNTRRLILEAQVSQKYLPVLPRIRSAHFQTPYQDSVQSIEAYNGRLLRYGKMITPGSNFIPVLFELDNVNNLVPGSYADLFLLTAPTEEALVVPRSALMRDYDTFYVYVQTGGERFTKRQVRTGVSDGKMVQITQGLAAGEWVVTQGAYQVKMASMSSAIPAHGHEH